MLVILACCSDWCIPFVLQRIKCKWPTCHFFIEMDGVSLHSRYFLLMIYIAFEFVFSGYSQMVGGKNKEVYCKRSNWDNELITVAKEEFLFNLVKSLRISVVGNLLFKMWNFARKDLFLFLQVVFVLGLKKYPIHCMFSMITMRLTGHPWLFSKGTPTKTFRSFKSRVNLSASNLQADLNAGFPRFYHHLTIVELKVVWCLLGEERGNEEQNYDQIAFPDLEEFMQVWLAPPPSIIYFNSRGWQISTTKSILQNLSALFWYKLQLKLVHILYFYAENTWFLETQCMLNITSMMHFNIWLIENLR